LKFVTEGYGNVLSRVIKSKTLLGIKAVCLFRVFKMRSWKTQADEESGLNPENNERME